jgi:hypothetical protein
VFPRVLLNFICTLFVDRIDNSVFRRAREVMKNRKNSKAAALATVAEVVPEETSRDDRELGGDEEEKISPSRKLRTMFFKAKTGKNKKKHESSDSLRSDPIERPAADISEKNEEEQVDEREPADCEPSTDPPASPTEDATAIEEDEEEDETANEEDQAAPVVEGEAAAEEQQMKEHDQLEDENAKMEEESKPLAVTPTRGDDDTESERDIDNCYTPQNPGFLCGCI